MGNAPSSSPEQTVAQNPPKMGNCQSSDALEEAKKPPSATSQRPSSQQSTRKKSRGFIVKGTFRANLVLDSRCRTITDKFEIIKDLGGGGMGIVRSARKIKATYDKNKEAPPGLEVAIKSALIEKNAKHNVKMLRAEIDIMKAIDHPNCVKAYECYKTSDKNLHMAFEFLSGGNLYKRFPQNKQGERVCFTEREAAPVIHQLLSALAHMHAKGLVHRDVKFENIMYESPTSQSIKLIDFGAAGIVKEGEYLDLYIGTTYTMAPEVLGRKYNEKADIWSVGVILYMMLSLTKPFYGESKAVIQKKIIKGDFKFYSPRWEGISNSTKTFIETLLTKDPQKRLSAESALSHLWFNDFYPQSKRNASDETIKGVHESMIQYSKFDTMKKIGLNIVAHQATTDEILDLKAVFDTFDKSKSGNITFSEFVTFMKSANSSYNEEEIQNIFENVTLDITSKILHYTGFLAASFIHKKELITCERLWRAFDRLDCDKRGVFSENNLRELLGTDFNEADWEDFKGIKFDSFLKMFEDVLCDA